MTAPIPRTGDATLFPRTAGPSRQAEVIGRAGAHRVLDLARAGRDLQVPVIADALRATGDLRGLNPCERAHCLQRQADLHAAMDDTAEWAEASQNRPSAPQKGTEGPQP